jgi:mannose-6-phosphate isomerase-like protein (cupin superfamily)
MRIITEAGVYTAPDGGEPNDWVVHLSTGDLSLGTYCIPAGGLDDQTPHTEDEIYVVRSGRATLKTGPGTAEAGPAEADTAEAGPAKAGTPEVSSAEVGPGSVIFVPAGETHTFTDVTEDLALLVFFAPPYGSRAPGSAT